MKAVFVFLLLSSPCSAALLAEFAWHDTRTVPAGAVFSINTLGSPTGGPFAHWKSTTSTENETFVADAETLADFNDVWTNGRPGTWNSLYMSHSYAGSSHSDPDAKFGVGLDWLLGGSDGNWADGGATGWHGWYGQAFVPQKGLQFWGYTLTSVERVVTPTTHTIRVLGEPVVTVPGDYNIDGTVDAADYSMWRRRSGPILFPFAGPRDLPNDATPGVDAGDYDVWRANFGKSMPSGALVGQQVPELSTLESCFVLIAALLLIRYARQVGQVRS